MDVRGVRFAALALGCAAPPEAPSHPSAPSETDSAGETAATTDTLGDPTFVARIDIGDDGRDGAVFALPGDLTGDGEPDLLATTNGVTTWLVPGPLAGFVRVEQAASAAFTSGSGDLLLPAGFVRVDAGDGSEALLVLRSDGLARLDLPVVGNVDVDTLPLVIDFGGRFLDPAQVWVQRIGEGVWVGGDVAYATGEGWLLEGPWTAPRTLDAAVLHVFGDAPVIEEEYGYVDRVTAHRVTPVGDVDGSGTPDIALYQPVALLDLGLRGEVSVTPSLDAALGVPQRFRFAGIGDVTGDGVDDLLVDGPETGTACVLAGPVGRDTPGIGTAATPEGCWLVIGDAADGDFTPGPDAWALGDLDGDGAGEWLAADTRSDGRSYPVMRGGLRGVLDLADARIGTQIGDLMTFPGLGTAIGELDGAPGTDLIVARPTAAGPMDGPSPTWWELHRALAP